MTVNTSPKCCIYSGLKTLTAAFKKKRYNLCDECTIKVLVVIFFNYSDVSIFIHNADHQIRHLCVPKEVESLRII